MFQTIKIGETAVVDGQEYRVVRVSMSRFWLMIDGQPVKFTKKNGIEYGAGRNRLARPVDEAPAPQQRKVARALAIGDLPDAEFDWLLEVERLMGPGLTVMDAIKAGWEWQPLFAQHPDSPAIAALTAIELVQ